MNLPYAVLNLPYAECIKAYVQMNHAYQAYLKSIIMTLIPQHVLNMLI